MEYNWKLSTNGDYLVVSLNGIEHMRIDKTKEAFVDIKNKKIFDLKLIGGTINDVDGYLKDYVEP